MKLKYFLNEQPQIDADTFIAPGAQVLGACTLKKGASIWHNAVCRGDVNRIIVGEYSNVQDLSTLHCDHIEVNDALEIIYPGHECILGNFVTIGHNCVIHACRIDDECLIGMNSVVMDGAHIGAQSIVGAGAVVTKGKIFAPRSLILGSPARLVRTLSAEEVAHLREHAMMYYRLAQEHKARL